MKIIMHLDMNSYFASVEQQSNPLLRGKPVGVCAYLHKNGCILSASIEAKKCGIKTGQVAHEAKKLCPKIVLLENQPAKYRAVTGKLFSLLADYTEKIEPCSIDEAFLDLSGHALSFEAAEKLAQEIKQRIKLEIGEWLQCSIGISYTRFLAKTGSNYQKPDGLTIIRPDDLTTIWRHLQLTDIFGINKRTARRFNMLGIFTPPELHRADPMRLLNTLGKPGYHLWQDLNGFDTVEVNDQPAMPKSIGHSYCLPQKTTDLNYLKSVLFKLCEKTGRRLREQQLETKQVAIYWRYLRGDGDHGQIRVTEPIFGTWELYQTAVKPLQVTTLPDKVVMLAVTARALQEKNGQLSLLEASRTTKEQLVQALDTINDKHGEYTVHYGRMHRTTDSARDRIGFRKTVMVNPLSHEPTYLPLLDCA